MSTNKELIYEFRNLRKTLERIEALLEELLIGIDKPLPDEVEEIRKYEREKKLGKIKLENLDTTPEYE